MNDTRQDSGPTPVSRRDFLRIGAGLVAAAAVGRDLAAGVEEQEMGRSQVQDTDWRAVRGAN